MAAITKYPPRIAWPFRALHSLGGLSRQVLRATKEPQVQFQYLAKQNGKPSSHYVYWYCFTHCLSNTMMN